MTLRDDLFAEQWEVIKVSPAHAKRDAYFEYCKLVVQAVEAGDVSITEGAYNICGISGQVIDHLTPADKEIMNIACDLELPEAHRGRPESDWQKLAELVTSLRHSDENN